MNTPDQHDRRQFLRYSAFCVAFAAFPGLTRAMDMASLKPSPGFNQDVEFELVAEARQVSILSQGPATWTQSLSATLLKGPKNAVTALPNNYLGPILNFQQGQKVRAIFKNRLKEASIVHWHGLHVPQASDGHPMYTIQSGDQYVYEFEVVNRAGTSFYHSHAHELTAEQVYRGLAGLIIVNDAD